MSSRKSIYFVILCLVLCPMLQLGGHFVNLAEIYLYCAFLVNIKNFKKNDLVRPYVYYGVLMALTILLTSAIASSSINNHDIYQLRNCAQAICAIFLFDMLFSRVVAQSSKAEFRQFLIVCFGILSIPFLIVYLQRVDFLGFRSLVVTLYKPQFYFLGSEEFSSYRYTSVFKDFFTFACYSIVYVGALFYFFIRSELKIRQKQFLIFLLVLSFLAQFFISRTSLIIIPLFVFFTVFFLSPKKIVGGRTRKAFMILGGVPLSIGVVVVLLSTELVNVEWVGEITTLLGLTSDQGFSSYDVMNEWNKNFWSYLADNPSSLFMPHHAYNLTVTVNPGLYTDSFYAQEIYRYGIYGLFAYSVFALSFLMNSIRKSLFFVMFLAVFVVLNYKGGNVFLMQKNTYMYPLFFIVIIYIEKISLNACVSRSEESL